MKVLGYIFLLALIFTGWFCAGFLYAEPIVEVREVEIPVEVRVEVPIELRKFGSEAELRNWLNRRDRTVRFVGVADFNSYDCDDFARDMVELARADGYDIYVQWVETHWLCMTTIGNDIYFIEPQTNEFWKAGELD